MRILIIGGTGFTGPHIVQELSDAGHQVATFHRGKTERVLPAAVRELLGDKLELQKYKSEFKNFAPDVVINMIAVTRADAQTFLSTFCGICRRAIIISSADVYRAYGRLHQTEPGPPDPTPLTEDSPLRQQLSLGGAAYDKVGVENLVRSAPEMDTTVIRYPAVYGPGDSQRRLFYHVKRMADNRPAILLPKSQAGWHWPHAYSENAAHAVALAVTNPASTGAVFNIAEAPVLNWQERVKELGLVMGWSGQVLIVPDEAIPEHLLPESSLKGVPNFRAMPDYRQDYKLDSSRIRAELGYAEVVPLDEGLRRTVSWLQESPPKIDEAQFDYSAEDALISQYG